MTGAAAAAVAEAQLLQSCTGDDVSPDSENGLGGLAEATAAPRAAASAAIALVFAGRPGRFGW